MIIFDLDGTLADCEHRRHFVDPKKDFLMNPNLSMGFDAKGKLSVMKTNPEGKDCAKWKPDWKSFYEACDEDSLIKPVSEIWHKYEVDIALDRSNLAIWSGRCESVREKTLEWLTSNLFGDKEWFDSILKMRPIGDYTPDDQLKERWLDEYLLNLYPPLEPMEEDGLMDKKIFSRNSPIEMVFDDRKKVVEMWRRRGIFVFDVSQGKGDF